MSLADENVRCRHATSALSPLKLSSEIQAKVELAFRPYYLANLLPSEENLLPENQTADFQTRLLDSRFVDIATPPTERLRP